MGKTVIYFAEEVCKWIIPLNLSNHQVLFSRDEQAAHDRKDKFVVSYPMARESLFHVVIMDWEQSKTWEHDHWGLPVSPEAVRAKFSSWGVPSRGLVEVG